MEYRHFTIEIDADRWAGQWVAIHTNYTGLDCEYPFFTGHTKEEVMDQIDNWLADCPHLARASSEGGEYCNDCDENIGG